MTTAMMGERQLKFLEFVPLILYVTFARAASGDHAGAQWQIAFIVGGILSVAVMTILLRKKRFILNRITLGVNLFLISGGAAVLLHLNAVLGLYWRWNPAPMFTWILGVGAAATLLSPHGFIGVRSTERRKVRWFSVMLLAAATIALGISVAFQGKVVYADIVPFIGLFIVNDRLRAQCIPQ